MKKTILSAAVALFAMASCSKEIQGPAVEGYGSDEVHSLSVGIEAGAYQSEDETKASMKAIVRAEWKEGDKVSVVNARTGCLLGGCLQATEDGELVTFAGDVVGTINAGDILYYIYPALADNSVEEPFEGYEISLQSQTYDSEERGNVCFYGYAVDTSTGAYSISKNIKFNIVTAYVHLNMSNLPAKGAALTSLDLSNVNGGFKWVCKDGVVSAAACYENQGVSVSCSNVTISKSGNAIVRFAIPASDSVQVARVLTVNKAYTNSNYSKAIRKAAGYYNQLYSSWQSNNVTIEDKGTEVKVTVDNGGSTESAEGILPVEEAFQSNKPASISMGGVGTITFNQDATAKILDNANEAGSTSVFFKVEDVTETKPVQDANIVYEVTMKTVDEKGVEVFADGKAAGVATVVVPLGDNVESVQSVSLVKEDGTTIEGGVVAGSVKFEKPYLTFDVNHFSKYAIKYTTKDIDAVAEIGGRKYETLASAVAAVQNGQTITLLKNVGYDGVAAAAGISVPSGKNFTVDFGGFSYAMECPGAGSARTMTAGFQLLKDSNITFKNGTIKCTEANKNKTWTPGSTEQKGIALMIQNYANLTLEDMTIDATNIAHNGAATRYAISNNSGNVEFKGATSIISATGDYAFDACKYDTYTKPVVTWNSTGTVNGVIELSGGDFIVAKDLKVSRPIRSNSNPSTLTVNSGVTVSPAEQFQKVKTSFANDFNEGTSGVVIVNRGGNLTINGEGTITSTDDMYCYAAVSMTEKGEDTGAEAKLTVEGDVTLEGYYYGIAGNGNRHNTDITISGGTVKGIEVDNCSGIYHPQDGKLTINGGTIEGATGVYVKSGEVATVNGGTIKGTGTKTEFVHNNSGAKVTGDAFIVENCGYPGGTPVVNISGGKFVSEHAAAISSYGYGDNPALKGFISGGLFNTKPADDLIVAGKAAVENTDESTKAEYHWTIGERPNVAKIGTTEYATLAEAVAAVPTDGTETTITMIANHEILGNAGVTIAKTQKVVLDLAGFTVKNLVNESKASQVIKNEGTLKITGNGTLTNALAEGVVPGDWPTYNYATNLITNHCGILTIENGTFANTQDSGITYALDNNSNGNVATATINGGTFTSVGNSAVRMFCNSTTAANTLTINGGYFEGKYYAVSVSNASGATKVGTLNVNGGEFESTANEYNACIANWKSNMSSNITVNISGGKFNDYVLIASNASVTGGLFSHKEYTDPDDDTKYELTKYVAAGYEVVENTDAQTKNKYPYTIAESQGVCKIGDTTYETLAEAVAAVPTDGTKTTITMIADFETTEKVTIAATNNVVLELNGKKISYTTDGFGSFIENKGQLTVQDSGENGIITAKFSNPNWMEGCYTINNAGTYTPAGKLVIESGTIENTSPTGLAWPISNGIWGTYADLVINGGTIHSTNYVPVREYLQYGGKKTIVINGGKFISDNSRAIAVQLNDATVAEQGSYVEINGGEFSCNGSGILYVDLHAANINTTGFTMTVNDGKFKNANMSAPVLVYDEEGNSQTSAVLLSNVLKGGVYSAKPADVIVAEGFEVVANSDGTYPWKVQKK